MLKALAALILSGAVGFGLACAVAATPKPAANMVQPSAYQIIATDSHGDSYIAGMGDDCAAAWEGVELPAEWRDIICVPISR